MHDSWLVVATFFELKNKSLKWSQKQTVALLLGLHFDLQSLLWGAKSDKKKKAERDEGRGENDRKEGMADYMENQKQTQTTFCIF